MSYEEENAEQICKDCGQPFELTPGEIDFYKTKMEQDSTFAMPKRCKECRAKKKKEGGAQRRGAEVIQQQAAPGVQREALVNKHVPWR